MKKLHEITIPDYIRVVKLSESRRAKYFNETDTLPKKYQPHRYQFRSYRGERVLFDDETNKRVVANPRAAGTPRYMMINGQYMYSGNMHHSQRSKMIGEIKENFKPAVVGLPVITQFPLRIEVEVHDLIHDPEIRHQLWDVDNRFYPYGKAFSDLLCELSIIPDDHCLYITGSPAPLFYPILPGEQRKLIFKIYHDDREILKKFDVPLWKENDT